MLNQSSDFVKGHLSGYILPSNRSCFDRKQSVKRHQTHAKRCPFRKLEMFKCYK